MTLRQISVIDQKSVTDRQTDEVNDFTNWSFTSETSDGGGRIYYRNGLVAYIHILPKSSLSMEEVVNKLGPPDQVLAVSGCADTRYLYSVLLYLDKGIYVLTPLGNRWEWSKHTRLARDRSVLEVVYFKPEFVRELLMTHVSSAWHQSTYEELNEAFEPWHGFDHDVTVLDACY